MPLTRFGFHPSVRRIAGAAVPGARLALIWLPAAVLSMYVKQGLMLAWGFRFAALELGRSATPGLGWQGQFSRWEKLSYFRNDLLLGFVIVPALLVATTVMLRPLLRVLIAALISTLASLLLFSELEVLHDLRHFVPLDLLLDAVVWGWNDPGVISSYLPAADAVKLLAAAVATGGAVWWNVRSLKGGRERRLHRKPGEAIALLFFWSAILCSAGIAWLVRMPTSRYHESAMLWVSQSLTETDAPSLSEFKTLDNVELMRRYRELANAPARERSRYFGVARGCDVVFFVFETGPARCLAVEGDLEDFPTLRRLRARSFLGREHYSDAPTTNRALFSLFTSLYPLNWKASPGRFTGIVSTLDTAGYQTAVYSPKDPGSIVAGDDERLSAMGFQKVLWPQPPRKKNSEAADQQPAWQDKADLDKATLSLLIRDLERWQEARQNFMVVFLPQIGHGPWPDVSGGKAKNVVERGRAVMALQDAWLGQLVDELDTAGRLQKTLIVVTADHGIRTHAEDPAFRGDRVDEYTFHVPLLIWAPRALEKSQTIDWLTSHIDVSPSILDLLGIEEGRNFEEGSPLWDSAIRQRRIYFFSKSFLAADGYAATGQFAMWSYLSDSVYRNDRLTFGDHEIVPRHSIVDSEVRQSIGSMEALQRVVFARVGE